MENKALLEAPMRQIEELTEMVVPLYDVIEDYFFQDVDYRQLEPMLPQWIADSGRSPESAMRKEEYEKLRQVYNDPLSNRIIHWYDVQIILTAFQDRLVSVERHLEEVYRHIPAYCTHEDSEYTACTRGMDDTATKVHMAINEVFVALASSLDLLTKIVYECSQYDPAKFSVYKRLKSRSEGILYKKVNYGFDELKRDGLLYSEPACVRTVCSFRDEFVHNGSWDYRCAVYYPSIDGEPVDPFVLMPDVDDTGLLVSSGSRNKFYSKGEKINILLPGLVKNVIEVLNKTVSELKTVLVKKTVTANKEKATKAAMFTLTRNQVIGFKALAGNKFTASDLIDLVDFLKPRFMMTSTIIAELCRGLTITSGLGEQLIYAGLEKGRPYRMLMFVLLLNETTNLKSDYKLAYHLLKEAYLMTDNIYGQLKHSIYPFVLADYLAELEKALPDRNAVELEVEEKMLFESLPDRISVFRGMCDEEKQSGNFGISWSLEEKYAMNYVFYTKNEVPGTVGWLAEMEIDKKDVFAIWGVKGKGKEIVVDPKKCKNVTFTKVVRVDEGKAKPEG